MKKIPILVISLFIIVVGYLYVSPYLALNSIKNAAQSRDAETLSNYIDFPSLKESLRDQVKAKFAKEMMEGESNNGFEALGAVFATAMVDQLIDGLITPDGIAALMLQKEKEEPSSKEMDRTQEQSEIIYNTSYTSFNSFRVDIGNADEDNVIKVVLHRDGLNWKITQLDLPLNSF